MAIICSICQNKQGGWYEDYPLSDEHKNMRVCATCHGYRRIIEKGSNFKEMNTAFEYFGNIFRSVTVSQEVDFVISGVIETGKRVIEEETEKQIERERLQKERREEMERSRIVEENKLREEREQRYQIRVENLKSRGVDGYYEYKVVSLMDIEGIFRSDSGHVDTIAMTNVLNEFGLDGWHLVTAYSNELGKNLVSIAGIGTNSTADENVMIFERFVKI